MKSNMPSASLTRTCGWGATRKGEILIAPPDAHNGPSSSGRSHVEITLR